MRCPYCEHADAYTGLLWVHCLNEDCKYFDPLYAAKMKQEKVIGSLFDQHIQDKAEKLILLRGKTQDSSKSPTSP